MNVYIHAGTFWQWSLYQKPVFKRIRPNTFNIIPNPITFVFVKLVMKSSSLPLILWRLLGQLNYDWLRDSCMGGYDWCRTWCYDWLRDSYMGLYDWCRPWCIDWLRDRCMKGSDRCMPWCYDWLSDSCMGGHDWCRPWCGPTLRWHIGRIYKTDFLRNLKREQLGF